MRIRHVVLAAGVCGAVCAAGARADEPNAVGYPKEELRGGVGAYRIWYEGGAWHLRTSCENSAGKKENLMVFAGTVRCDGKLTVEPKVLEKKGKTADTLTPTPDGKGFDFEFRTFGAIDEAVFKAADGAKALTFKLKIDGTPAPPFRILIGADNARPEKGDFKLPAHPKK